jgi:hypothetical protein
MACPFFQPQSVAPDPKHRNSRLPLLAEYDGFCRASAEPLPAPSELRYACCNHGYSRGLCHHFPSSETRSCLRFDVLRQNPESLELLFVEERDHTPVSWRALRYTFNTESIEPDLQDICARAQVRAFCRSYLARFTK